MLTQNLNGKFLKLIMAGSLATGITACSQDDDEKATVTPIVSEQPEQQGLSLVGTIAQDASFSTLKTALTEAALLETLEGGPFTVFAPTDEAFAKIPAETLNNLLQDKEALTNVLLYHVVSGELKAEDVLASDKLRTAQGQDLSVNLKNGMPYLNDSMIVGTDRIANNGIIHTIDTVLLPPAAEETAEETAEGNTIADIAISNPDFSTLVELLVAADLVDAVSGDSKLTVFAPTNAAFAKIPAEVVESLKADKEALRQVLLYHVVPGVLKAEDVLSKDILGSVSEKPLAISLRDGKPFINDSMIIATDVEASNGVIHVIDSVLLPPADTEDFQPEGKTIADIAISNPNFSTLVSLLVAADLVDAVSGDTKLTVFAPTNAAFAKIPAEVVESLKADKEALRQVLLYHVVPGTYKAEAVLGQESLTSLNKKHLAISLRDGKPFINDSMITATDIDASNGVIHVIDTVLIP